MPFATLIPDWNSLDSVRRAHSDLELAALVFFALLVVFDVLAHFSEGKKRERPLEKIGLCFFAVPVGFDSGLHISIESQQSVESLNKIPGALQPPHLQAAIKLQDILRWSVSPLTENAISRELRVDTGTSETVKIAVGRKPLE